MTFIFLTILVALIFEFINGFHDTANSIATVVSTKVLTPRQAIFLAAITNFLGAIWGTAVAKTIASGLIDQNIASAEVVFAALTGGIIWNLITWYYGLPSSSSHALVGGLCGAAYAAADNNLAVIIWSKIDSESFLNNKGILWKVIIPMVTSPVCGFFIGLFFMGLLYFLFQNFRPKTINSFFGKAQIFSAASMGFMHGTNDAQKTMGIIALTLLAATSSGAIDTLPHWLHFLKIIPDSKGSIEIATWIKAVCAITMAVGTAAGGWKIIKTLGHKLVKLQPIHGFAAETSSSIVLFTASHFGIPVSTTHNITSAIMGVGAAKHPKAIKWLVVEKIIWAWILTLPASAFFAYLTVKLFKAL